MTPDRKLYLQNPAGEMDHLKSNGKKKNKRVNRAEQNIRHDERKQRTANDIVTPQEKPTKPTGRRYDSDEQFPWWIKD